MSLLRKSSKMVKMHFPKTVMYNLDVAYEAGVHEVPEEMVARWERRGATKIGDSTIVEPKIEAPVQAAPAPLAPAPKKVEDAVKPAAKVFAKQGKK